MFTESSFASTRTQGQQRQVGAVLEGARELHPGARAVLFVADTTFIQWAPFMRAWKRMRNVMGTHPGLSPGDLIRGWRVQADPDAFLAAQYEAHNAQVKASVPADQFLVFNVKEGWAPLCQFLGKVVPDEPFPNVNESAELMTATKVMKPVSHIWLPVVAAPVALASTGLSRWRR